MLNALDITQNDKIVFSGDLNICFNYFLEISGGNPILKKVRI